MLPKILLVDDREDNLFSLSAILEPEGYRVVKADSGRQALKILLQEYDFALILMDVEMPNLNGFETASLIYEREKLKHIPIVFITAHSYSDENIYKGYKSGAVDYIYKPINTELLKAKVAVFVELYKKNHALLAQEQKLISINKSLENEVNERKNSEEKVKMLNLELLQNIDRLEAANKDLDRFAFMASHDLQEPLRKIRAFSDRLAGTHDEVLDADGKMYLSRIQNAAERMQLLIKDILTFSKISTIEKKYVRCDLNELLKDVLGQLEGPIMEKNAEIQIGKMPVMELNPVLIQPLFLNLINNSLKYSKKDGPLLIKIYSDFNVRSTEAGPNNGILYNRIFVEDNGIGFEQKYAEQIFSMFKRLHHSSEYEGTGIGLALCKKIVEEHNGFISAIGREGEGSTFIVSLPVVNSVGKSKADMAATKQAG